ncbi:hypothetical protein LSH36_69g06005 [Paralvinella palmiformis]|uniref:L-fucose mutarotase n=1 Tax=Paralvinella palmiformis TaxID=53620 RepID=A0AAD9NEC0_9ANNE|nr:hypothetical protein LSH36_69g06005 [Paralvinella palmiformis]
MPLKGIPFIISPELLTALYKAGHGDEIGITYLYLPMFTFQLHQFVEMVLWKSGQMASHKIPVLLEAILKLFPLDTYVDSPCAVMNIVPEDRDKIADVPVWSIYKEIANKAENRHVRELLVFQGDTS